MPPEEYSSAQESSSVVPSSARRQQPQLDDVEDTPPAASRPVEFRSWVQLRECLNLSPTACALNAFKKGALPDAWLSHSVLVGMTKAGAMALDAYGFPDVAANKLRPLDPVSLVNRSANIY